jgi:hypothetical protein
MPVQSGGEFLSKTQGKFCLNLKLTVMLRAKGLGHKKKMLAFHAPKCFRVDRFPPQKQADGRSSR